MVVLGLTDAAPCGAAIVIDGVVAAACDEPALARNTVCHGAGGHVGAFVRRLSGLIGRPASGNSARIDDGPIIPRGRSDCYLKRYQTVSRGKPMGQDM